MGWVAVAPRRTDGQEPAEPPSLVRRKAGAEDLRRVEELKDRAAEALCVCQEKVGQLGLPMKLLDAEYALEGRHITIYFSAEGRVDFRELVRDLAATFSARVELRQLGPRDEAQLLGGYGRCGRPLCCACFKCHFPPISIRMAKEQGLPLDPSKVSGVCGRLMCCLSHETELYRQLKELSPKIGDVMETPLGKGKVVETHLMKEMVTVQLENTAIVKVPWVDASPPKVEAPPQQRSRRSRRRRPRKPAKPS